MLSMSCLLSLPLWFTAVRRSSHKGSLRYIRITTICISTSYCSSSSSSSVTNSCIDVFTCVIFIAISARFVVIV